MYKLNENIKQRRMELGLSQDELAQLLGYTSRSTIAKIENGTNDIPFSKVEDFAKALKTSPAYLMGWTMTTTPNEFVVGDELSKLILQISKELKVSYELLVEIYIYNPLDDISDKELTYDNLFWYFKNAVDAIEVLSNNSNVLDYENYGLRPIQKKRFPMLGEIACGEPIFCNEDYESFVEASSNIDADFCLTAKGDSMINARIFDGDIVFVKSQNDVDNGEIAVVVIDDEATLKRVYKYPNRLELRPENPTYKVLNYEGEQLNHICILGKAVTFMSVVR